MYKDYGGESESWLKMNTTSFPDIVKQLNLIEEWKYWSDVKKNQEYLNKTLVPINMYSAHFSKRPKIGMSKNNTLLLDYYTYSDIFLYIRNDTFYAVEKAWQRQFYPSIETDSDHNEEIFSRKFRFYLPWIINENVKYDVISNSFENFFIKEGSGFFKKTSDFDKYKDTDFIDFYFKNTIGNNGYKIIKSDSYMFTLEIKDLDVIDRIINEYN
jgi:hypothetical protein